MKKFNLKSKKIYFSREIFLGDTDILLLFKHDKNF